MGMYVGVQMYTCTTGVLQVYYMCTTGVHGCVDGCVDGCVHGCVDGCVHDCVSHSTSAFKELKTLMLEDTVI